MSNDLRDKGISIANEAVAADNAKNYPVALEKYGKAAEYLLKAQQYEKNPVTKKNIDEKIREYIDRAETIKKGTEQKGVAAGGGGKAAKEDDDDDDDDDGPEPEMLTAEQLAAAEREMDEELSKLVGMQSVKDNMKKLCKQLSLDIKRKQEGQHVLDAIRHMIFTGNPGVGKTTISRLIASLFHKLGVANKDTVVEVQKGDLVAGYVNQTAGKTKAKIREARGGILFVDEAYQLTQNLMRGQTDFAGEAIDEMMKVMNNVGRKTTTFVFAGYKKEMDEFVSYNAGIESRIKYRFHFDDYSVPELVTIAKIKITGKGYKMAADAERNLGAIIDQHTDAELRSKYNGRLVDNLMQWSSDEMNTRLPLNASGADLITLTQSDFLGAIKRFKTARPPTKVDMTIHGVQVDNHLHHHALSKYSDLFARAGYRQLYDLLILNNEKDVRALGVNEDADIRRVLFLVQGLERKHRLLALEEDARYMFLDPHGRIQTVSEWLDSKDLGKDTTKLKSTFDKHKV